jgi:hypothetical protein
LPDNRETKRARGMTSAHLAPVTLAGKWRRIICAIWLAAWP